MHYQFAYFHEPADEEKPIQKLDIDVEFDVESDIDPASYEWHPVTTYSVKFKGFTAHDRMGMDVTSNFAFIREKIQREFDELHADRALERYLND
jgi:hypothetical protein